MADDLSKTDQPSRLPEPLASWAEAERRRARSSLPSSGPRAFDAWTARFIPGAAAGFDAILLSASPGSSPPAVAAAGLTRREAEVLALVGSGMTNVQIALELAISDRTVAKHLQHAYEKLGVTSRTAAVAEARARSAAAPAPAQARLRVQIPVVAATSPDATASTRRR
jgi:DNA-binding CsgD family transcriptional regulator